MTSFTATPRDVASAFATVLPHVGSDAHLPMLTVVHVEISATTMTLAATDRYTVALYRADLEAWAPKDVKVDVAPITVNLYARDLRRLFAFAKDARKAQALWTFTAERLSVELDGGDTLSVRTVGVDFVDYRKFLADLNTRPKAPSGLANVQPEQVEKFIRSAYAVRECEGERYAPLHVWSAASVLKPLAVTVGRRFAGFLMPTRVDGEVTLELESFLAPAPVAPALPVGGVA